MSEISNAEFDAAHRRGEELAKSEPRARAAKYDAASGQVILELTNGCTFAFPARGLQGLADARDGDLAKIEVLGSGYGIHWEALDADFTVPGLLMGLFGTRAWMAREQARRAGSASSPAKAAAARQNGKLGGRPRRRLATGS